MPHDLLSFCELRERHLALLREWNAADEASLVAAGIAAGGAGLAAEAASAGGSEGAGGSADSSAEPLPAPNGRLPLAPAAEALRASATALGGWLDDPEERDRAQGVIDYWTSALASLPGREFPELLHLAAFDPALPAAAVEQAETIFAGHEGTAREADAEAMLSCLVRPGDGDKIVCRPPVERVDLEHADGVTDQTASQGELLDELVAAGLIRKLDGETPAQDRFDFTHGSVARAWPRMRALLDRRRSANATRDKLRATAHLWKESQGDSGYLLTGPVLDDAGRYFGEDKLLDEFLLASRHSENRWKTTAPRRLGPRPGARRRPALDRRGRRVRRRQQLRLQAGRDRGQGRRLPDQRRQRHGDRERGARHGRGSRRRGSDPDRGGGAAVAAAGRARHQRLDLGRRQRDPPAARARQPRGGGAGADQARPRLSHPHPGPAARRRARRGVRPGRRPRPDAGRRARRRHRRAGARRPRPRPAILASGHHGAEGPHPVHLLRIPRPWPTCSPPACAPPATTSTRPASTRARTSRLCSTISARTTARSPPRPPG